jgi:membrane protein DedA with SNARE-associated domain
MERLGPALKGVLAIAVTLKLRHHLHGPAVDYVGLAAAAAASWLGVPGPGEPVLIAAGVFAARHKLDIAGVVVVAWLGATAGGIGGWVIGRMAGRGVIVARGPLQRMRLAAVARGDEVFQRWAVFAILLTPSWIAGIHRVRTPVYLLTNAAGALLWAAGIGLGAYYVGPTVVDFVQDLGLVTAFALVALVATGVGLGLLHRRRAT